MFDDYDHITISYHHRDDGWFEMELYLPLLVDCPRIRMPLSSPNSLKMKSARIRQKSCWPTGSGSAISTSVTARMRQMPM